MKICHCIKITPQELDALETTCNILQTVTEDEIISSAFEEATGYQPEGLQCAIGELIDFIRNFGD